MKKVALILFLVIDISCFGQQRASKNKIKNISSKNFVLRQDSMLILTPYVEVKEKANSNFMSYFETTDNLRTVLRGVLRTKYPKANYFQLPFLYKDAKTVNASIEGKINYSVEKAPKELISKLRRNSVFISLYGYFGDVNRTTINFFIIDNKKEKWIMIEHFNYDISPLNIGQLKENLLKILNRISTD